MNRGRLLGFLSAVVLAAIVPVVLVACGGDDDGNEQPGTTTTPQETTTYTLGDIVIVAPAARANPNPVSAVFAHIENKGGEADRLVGAACDLAGMVQLHDVVTSGGQKQMQEVKGGIEIPAHGHVDLKPGGLHIMLMDLERPLKEGETIQVTLRFERAGEITIDVPVRKYENMSGEGSGSGMGH